MFFFSYLNILKCVHTYLNVQDVYVHKDYSPIHHLFQVNHFQLALLFGHFVLKWHCNKNTIIKNRNRNNNSKIFKTKVSKYIYNNVPLKCSNNINDKLFQMIKIWQTIFNNFSVFLREIFAQTIV